MYDSYGDGVNNIGFPTPDIMLTETVTAYMFMTYDAYKDVIEGGKNYDACGKLCPSSQTLISLAVLCSSSAMHSVPAAILVGCAQADASSARTFLSIRGTLSVMSHCIHTR